MVYKRGYGVLCENAQDESGLSSIPIHTDSTCDSTGTRMVEGTLTLNRVLRRRWRGVCRDRGSGTGRRQDGGTHTYGDESHLCRVDTRRHLN